MRTVVHSAASKVVMLAVSKVCLLVALWVVSMVETKVGETVDK